jgi:multicomponent K+:H+ antiporter subunit G
VHEVLIGLFVTMTTPVTFMLLARAALYRDRAEGRLPTRPEDGNPDGLPAHDASEP